MESENERQESTQGTKASGFLKTCLNGANTLCGIGILSVPYALSKGGWLSLLLLFLVALLCFYTGILLKKCMDSNSVIKSYPDIGHVAFGRKGRVTISMFLYLELFLVAVECLIMEGDNLQKLFPNQNFEIHGKKIGGKQGFILLTALIVLPTTWIRNLRYLAYVSMCGVISLLILILAVLWIGAFDGIGFHHRGELWKWSELPITISLFTFCYCGHAVFPTIYNSMEKKTQFAKVLLLCFTLSTVSYGSMSILGYLMFGEHIGSQVTLNLPTKNTSSMIAIYTTLIIPITKYALIVAPIAIVVEETFLSRDSTIRSCLIRTCLVLSTLFVALMIPFFGHVMAFIGAFVGVMLAIVFPCLCYWKIVIGFKIFSRESMIIFIIVLIGTFVGVIGTYTALVNIIKDVQTK